MRTRSLLATLAVWGCATSASAVSPYDLTYGIQWSYLNGGVQDERNGWLVASSDGTAWFNVGYSSYTGANFSMFGDQGNGGSWDSGYGQISGQGVILQGKSLPNIADHQAENQSYTRQHLSMQGSSAVLGWSSNGNQDPDANGIQGAWWGPTSDGVGRYSFENKGGPMTVKIAANGTESLKTNPALLTQSLRSESMVVSQADNTIWFVGGYQGAGNDVISSGDGTIGATTGYSPFIGRQSAAGVVSGPAKQSNTDGTSLFVSVAVNEISNRVIGVGYTVGNLGTAYWDADGDGTAEQTAPGGKTTLTMGLIGIYDSTTLALTGTVAWNSDFGDDLAVNVAATPDGGFVVTGRTKGSMAGYTNPALGVNDDIYIAKYSSAGALVWDWQSETANEDEGVSVSVDTDGNVYLGARVDVVRAGANNTNQPVISGDVSVTKFDSAGNLVWAKTLDEGGTLDDIFSASAFSKNKIYVASESNPVLGPEWTNINGYVAANGDDREILIQKLVPGDFIANGVVNFADVLFADAATTVSAAVDTYDFDGDGDSDFMDITYFYFNILDNLPGDTDGDGDIDDADLGTSFASYTGPVGIGGGRNALDGDTDGDGDVDDSDLGTSFSGYTGPLGPATVPEPTSLALIGLGGLALIRRRRA